MPKVDMDITTAAGQRFHWGTMEKSSGRCPLHGHQREDNSGFRIGNDADPERQWCAAELGKGAPSCRRRNVFLPDAAHDVRSRL
jgi:hypothetical protein